MTEAFCLFSPTGDNWFRFLIIQFARSWSTLEETRKSLTDLMSRNKKLCKWLFQTKMTYNVHEEKKCPFVDSLLVLQIPRCDSFFYVAETTPKLGFGQKLRAKNTSLLILLNQCTELQDVRYKLPKRILCHNYHHISPSRNTMRINNCLTKCT